MTSTVLRTHAENLTANRVQATADAKQLTKILLNMPLSVDTGDLVAKIIKAERLVDMLAEAEHHAWDAVSDAEQVEHEQMLDHYDSL